MEHSSYHIAVHSIFHLSLSYKVPGNDHLVVIENQSWNHIQYIDCGICCNLRILPHSYVQFVSKEERKNKEDSYKSPKENLSIQIDSTELVILFSKGLGH